jgi:photosynthetic reaction center cytochrome c subunit
MRTLPGWLVVALIFGTFANAQNTAGKSKTAADQTTDQRYKNIQVLKGIPADELIPAMQFIRASLGVQCGFCHVENHFDQDDKKPKQIARKMMQMMAAINQQNFDNHRKVTCNTCHRGAPRPVAIPVISETPSSPSIPIIDSEEKLPPNLPAPSQLVEKYVQASGGANAIQKISTRVQTGNADFGGHEVPVEVFDKAPSQRATVMHLPNGDNVTTVDGKQGWIASPGHPFREMPPSEVEEATIDADLQFPLHLKNEFGELQAAPPEKIGDRETYQLVAIRNGEPRLRLYFDEQSGLLLRMLRYSDSPLGLNPTRVDYADYRAVDGVQVPYRWTVARPGGQVTIQITEVKQNSPISQEKFVRPSDSEQSNTGQSK